MKDHKSKVRDIYNAEFEEGDPTHSAFKGLIAIVQKLFHSRKTSPI